MSLNWIGRVLGLSSEHGPASMLAGARSTDVVTPPVSLVDSDDLADELARARRYEHDLSIVVLATRPLSRGVEAHANGAGESGSRLPQMLALLSAAALRDVLRRSDVVCYQPADDLFVLALAESDGGAARDAVRRVQTHFRDRLRLRVYAGVARFPTDALTLDDLVAAAATRAADSFRPAIDTNGNGRAARKGVDGPRNGEAAEGRQG